MRRAALAFTSARAMIVGDLFDRYRHGQQPHAKVDEQIARLDRVNAFYSELIACLSRTCDSIKKCRFGG